MAKPERQSEKTKNAPVRLLLMGAGLFVVLVLGAGSALFWEAVSSPGMQRMLEALKGGAGPEKHNENKEADYLATLHKDREAKDRMKLVSDLYDYGDWLYNERPQDALTQYKEAAEVSKELKWDEWTAAALHRVGLAEHKVFLADGTRPDPAPVVEAIAMLDLDKSAKADEKRGGWLADLALLYADNGQYKEAEDAITRSLTLQKDGDKDDYAEALLNKAQIEVRQGRQKEAMQALIESLKVDDSKKSDMRELFKVAFNAEDGRARPSTYAKTRKLWQAKDYAGLDAYAKELRNSKAQLVTGEWMLGAFYDSLELEDEASDKQWTEHFDKLRAWIDHNPKSITAHTALASSLKDFAWRARGSGYAGTVSDEGWKNFRNRLEQAKDVLDSAEKLAEKCPNAVNVRQTVALGQGMEKGEYEDLVKKGVTEFPDYHEIYTSQAYFLQPRWHGEDGEWNDVAQRECNAVGGTAGDALYAQIAWSLLGYYDNAVDEAGIDYPRCKRGLEALRKQFPKSAAAPLMLARMAALAGDKDTLATLSKP